MTFCEVAERLARPQGASCTQLDPAAVSPPAPLPAQGNTGSPPIPTLPQCLPLPGGDGDGRQVTKDLRLPVWNPQFEPEQSWCPCIIFLPREEERSELGLNIHRCV